MTVVERFAEAVGGAVAGSDAVGRLFDGFVGLYVEGSCDRLGGRQVAGDLAPKAEHLEALGHHDGPVHGGEAGDQVRHLEDGLVQTVTGPPSLLAS